ncbi:MAG: Glycosyl transferase group 1 [Microgenomates group bacterium GW2011_GWC1_41_20]|uniref:Glycosyl transferase group 1 n=6 Tax=Candidatus Woeseibacteriota TaxID=1752722 RepID=A0A0G0QLM1_9BACT|nr:MAG: Glycosyl transferase group 1 [Candidatus Woesebacteria bacterium GW2011_GWB1_40_12]KKR89299.1 MAG: Glycosyl transferase group 1 [Candidatus Woesebacteria bacterium GW2011_GWD1_41_12]KKR98945.1 MAG: Glycosyl transferase group 1 [Microgenomates group bacterium GW2011_GWC1_41_20]KKS03709.1 MAG: Glycosyl transferase group 1 [Candidatus Woesebacteria bacterium GW2011_GWE1_41_24]KKS16936.1 MAG: Glycosyl transferase group 1 [Candidatus Woesebacteria bacterium GW2011_GWA1_41_7]OGM81000.1 MAG: 
MLTPYLPFPDSSGGQIRSYNLIKGLSKKHEITLFSLIKDDSERRFVPELEKYCTKVKVFRRSKSPWTLRNIFLTGFGPYPFLVIRNLSPQQKKAVKEEIRNFKYDLIHAETFYVMPHIPETKIPILLVEQTIEYLVYKHYMEGTKNPLLRFLLSLDVAKLKFWETNFWKKADSVVAVSESDKEEMRKLVPDLKVDLVPNGVNLNFFKEKDSWKDKEARILFIANFKWLQNVEAAELLLREVFPLVQVKLPDTKIWIVGQHIPEEILSYKKDNIIIDNLSEDDQKGIRDAYYESSVFVSPLRGPGGTRLKHLAAMAAKLPLVTTSVGAEGLGALDGKEVIIRNSSAEIAEATLQLLEDEKLAEKIAKNARLLVEEKFSWYKMGEYLDKIYVKSAKNE